MDRILRENMIDYNIVTIDDVGNLFVGHFNVVDRELLFKLCKFLITDLEYGFVREDKVLKNNGDDDLIKLEINGDDLIRRAKFSSDPGNVYEYDYSHLNLNSFLIFYNMLQELKIDFDFSEYNAVVKNFVKYDIIKKSNFTDIWRECSKNLSKDKDSIDFQTFKDVFSCGAFIEYVVDYEIKVDDLKNMNILKKLDVLLSEIAYNSELLGTYTKGKHK